PSRARWRAPPTGRAPCPAAARPRAPPRSPAWRRPEPGAHPHLPPPVPSNPYSGRMTTPVPPGPFTGRTVPEVARALRDGSTDPVELVERTLVAIHATQPVPNAFVTVNDDGARRAARLRADELARGTDRGPLHGVPVGVKDIVDTAALRTPMGSRHFADHVPAHD